MGTPEDKEMYFKKSDLIGTDGSINIYMVLTFREAVIQSLKGGKVLKEFWGLTQFEVVESPSNLELYKGLEHTVEEETLKGVKGEDFIDPICELSLEIPVVFKHKEINALLELEGACYLQGLDFLHNNLVKPLIEDGVLKTATLDVGSSVILIEIEL